MAILIWQDKYKIGIASMDAQHQKLLGLINALNDAVEQGHGSEKLLQTFQGMMDYVRVHFAEEERLMKACQYPAFDEQEIEHNRFVRKILDEQAAFRGGKAGVALGLVKYLQDWLIRHILGVDKKYVPYMKAKGIG